MAKPNPLNTSGFNSKSNIFHSLRLPFPLPPSNSPISITDHIFSLIQTSPTTTAIINATTGHRLSYSELFHQIETLAISLQSQFDLRKGDTALILSHNCSNIPILYFSLLILGVVISPSNPSSTKSELSRQIHLSKPVIVFAKSDTLYKILSFGIRYTVVLDSEEFYSLKTIQRGELKRVEVRQSDVAAILYSSGTTGMIKGVMLTHGNLTAMVTGFHLGMKKREFPAVVLLTVPYFHVYGFNFCLKSVAMGETVVVMERFELGRMMKALEEYRVTHLAVAPPVVVAMLKSDCMKEGYDLRYLENVVCSGAPLKKEAIHKFKKRFSNVVVSQAYGLTETTGGVFRTAGPEESSRLGANGRLIANCEAKIVDPDTGIALSPGYLGELWIRGPTTMKGYVGDEEASSIIMTSDGWLRTGDLCYIDNDGYLFVADRIKELIKYKGYQVAPAELEQLLQSHPQIIDAAVVPHPDDEAGQIPIAFVVKHSESCLSEAQVMKFVSQQVAPYKKIRQVEFIDSIPKNAQGKILRKNLVALTVSNLSAKL
ncbi:hypothetical protein ACHQM5_007988 [Ranunculus cassubicifolius]